MSKPVTVFMFSGQGSQYYQMGRSLFDANATFRQCMLDLDAVVQREAGISVIAELYLEKNGKALPFDRTLLSHPAIFMVEYALAKALIERGVVPDVAVGASLGSFAAASVAGILEPSDALSAIVRQARSLESNCSEGGMLAALCDPKLYYESRLSQLSELVAVNFQSHFVVAARTAELSAAEAELKARAATYQRLPVSFAFHSRWIDEAEGDFVAFMRTVSHQVARLPLVCCEQVAELKQLPPDYFWRVVRRPIRFRETIEMLETRGSHRYIDVGPAGTLATFLKYCLPAASRSRAAAVLTPYGRDLQNFDAIQVVA
jgi:bacillaene synthase trans-acting acyltransferase